MFNKDQKILPAGAAAAAIAVSVFAPGVAAAETASGSGSASLEEIIVTAAKREQSLSDVGMSITAVTGDALRLRGINSPTDLNGTRTPSWGRTAARAAGRAGGGSA